MNIYFYHMSHVVVVDVVMVDDVVLEVNMTLYVCENLVVVESNMCYIEGLTQPDHDCVNPLYVLCMTPFRKYIL